MKLGTCAILRRCLRDHKFSHFGTVPACDRQTQGTACTAPAWCHVLKNSIYYV